MTGTKGALHLVTASQRRGAEVFAADLVAALEHDTEMTPPVPSALPAPSAPSAPSGTGAKTHRLAALTPGPHGNPLGATPLAGRDQVQRTACCRHRKIPPLPSRSERATNLRSI